MSALLQSQHRNVLLLALCQAIFVCGQTTLIFLGGLVGFALASDKSLATLPISAVILGTAVMTIPASLFMRRVGRRAGFMTGAVIGIFAMLLCAAAIQLAAFWLFTLGALLVGFYNAFCQYYRFAAADVADEAFRPRAISLVLAGGVVAGVVGPALATQTRDLLAPVTYLASYLAVAGLTALALVLLSMVRIPRLSEAERRDSGRPLLEIARQPRFLAAVGAAMIAYGVMSLLMTATPLAMIGCGFPDEDAGYVIQWHVIGMFAPSFFTGHLISRFGLYNVMLTGALLLVACLAYRWPGSSSPTSGSACCCWAWAGTSCSSAAPPCSPGCIRQRSAARCRRRTISWCSRPPPAPRSCPASCCTTTVGRR